MKKMRWLSFVVLMVGCGDDSGTPPGNGVVCSEVDGMTACADTFCSANQYCEEILCSAGCQSNANCAAGTYCDKEGATGAQGAGVCRACSATVEDSSVNNPDAPATCDIEGNYIVMASGGNPSSCSEIDLPSDPVSVTKSGTTVAVTASEVGQLWECSLDESSCTCDGTLDVQGATATITWNGANGQIRASAQGIICDYVASRQ